MESHSTFTIEQARHSDAAGIIAAHVRSIREVCAKDYSAEQIDAWSGRDFKESIWQRTMDRDRVWVVKAHGAVVGFGHLRVVSAALAVVEGLYFTPDAKGHGVGRKLMSMIYGELSDRGVETVRLQSTRTAEGFYRAMGFSAIGDSIAEFRGVPVECIDMENRGPF